MAQYLPTSLHYVVWAVSALILFFLPLVRSTARWTALGAGIAGIIMVVWAVIEIVIMPRAAIGGPALGIVFAALLATFALRAYFEKTSP